MYKKSWNETEIASHLSNSKSSISNEMQSIFLELQTNRIKFLNLNLDLALDFSRTSA